MNIALQKVQSPIYSIIKDYWKIIDLKKIFLGRILEIDLFIILHIFLLMFKQYASIFKSWIFIFFFTQYMSLCA